MKTPKIAEALLHLDDDIISEAVEGERVKKKLSFVKWGAIAASIAAVALSTALLVPLLMQKNEGSTVDKVQTKYKDVAVQNAAIVWPWEYKTVAEKYLTLNFEGNEFGTRGREISEALIGERLGIGEATGQDFYEESMYTESFEVYSVKDVSSEYVVAVKMEGKYYVFDAHSESAPDTLGELMDTYSLEGTVRLDKFSYGEKYYSLSEYARVWDILSGCKSAPSVSKEEDASVSESGESISFTVTSEQLGTYKVVLRISEDGYLWTNVFDYAYIYNIGKNAASEIIAYAKANSKEIPEEPYRYNVIGRITKVSEGYFLLDDTEICVNEDDGKVYKIISTDLRVRRHLEFEKLGEGDIVIVYYDGRVTGENVIDAAFDMAEVYAIYDNTVNESAEEPSVTSRETVTSSRQ